MTRKVTGDKAWNWKGGRQMANGYKMILVETARYEYEHRHMMEKHLGRKLERNEVVHHINGDKLDNRIENLEVMDIAEHTRQHIKSGEVLSIAVTKFLPKKKPKEIKIPLTQEEKIERRKQKHREYYARNQKEIQARRSKYRLEDIAASGWPAEKKRLFAEKAKKLGLTQKELRRRLDKKAAYMREWKKRKISS